MAAFLGKSKIAFLSIDIQLCLEILWIQTLLKKIQDGRFQIEVTEKSKMEEALLEFHRSTTLFRNIFGSKHYLIIQDGSLFGILNIQDGRLFDRSTT